MNLLAIDTSTELASVALLYNGHLQCQEQGAQRQHAQLLLPMIEDLLSQADLGLNNLDGIVFGEGPGSFTGLRIACSIAKGLAYANDLPVYPVSSLLAIASQVEEEAEVLAVIDARMNQLYWGYSSMLSNSAKAIQVSNACDIPVLANKKIILAGVGYEAYLPLLKPELTAAITSQQTIYPKAQAMIHQVVSGQIKAMTAAEIQPLYIRNQIVQGESRG